MKVTITEEELYPFMFVEKYKGKGHCYEISGKLWKRYKKMRDELWKLKEIFQKIEERRYKDEADSNSL